MPRRALAGLLAAAVLVLAGCGADGGDDPAATPSPSVASPTSATATASPTASPTPKPSKSSSSLPEAHPAFSKHFNAKFYTSLNNDYAPFGFPEQADIVRAWDSRRDELGDCSTVAEMAAADKVKIKKLVADGEDGDPDADTIVIAYGYALPYLTGQIDPEGKEMLTLAIQRLRTFYAENDVREFRVMLSDLKSFPASDC